jgi:dihydroflavonol-4-reductase
MNEKVLITGISGFTAKHVALNLLQNGYYVRGTLRTPSRGEQVCQTLQDNGADISRLDFAEADLNSDSGWMRAARNCDYVLHLASPFPLEQPKDREALVPQAMKGTLRVLEAARAAEVKRIVYTSSMSTLMYRPNQPPQIRVTEQDWTDPEWDRCTPYIVSKTRAEKAVWEWAKDTGWEKRIAVVNPGFILGPTLDGRTNTSLDVIKLIMTGAYPAIPPIEYAIVDVRDLAELHVRAMTVPEAGGRRLIGTADALSMNEMGRVLREAFPEYSEKIPTRTLPAFLVRILANFNPTMKTIVPDIGLVALAENDYVTEMTGVEFRPAEGAVIAAGQSLIDHSVV